MPFLAVCFNGTSLNIPSSNSSVKWHLPNEFGQGEMLKASQYLTAENESESLNFSTLKQLFLKSAFASACVLLSLS